MKSITGVDVSGVKNKYKIGEKVWRCAFANVPAGWDIVRDCFINDTLLEPYARNTREPAVVLTEVSWTPLTGISKVKTSKTRRD